MTPTERLMLEGLRALACAVESDWGSCQDLDRWVEDVTAHLAAHAEHRVETHDGEILVPCETSPSDPDG